MSETGSEELEVENAGDSELASAKTGGKDALQSVVASPRDVPISTIIRMMGLPTKGELLILEQKIDALTTKVNSIANKLERVLPNFEHGSEFDRIDVQLSDIRTTLREILPKAVAQLSSSGVRPAVSKKTNSGEQ